MALFVSAVVQHSRLPTCDRDRVARIVIAVRIDYVFTWPANLQVYSKDRKLPRA